MAGFMITAASSGSGKTMITCGLLELFKRKGLNPLACKCGPDYIDGLFHKQVLELEGMNLDSYFEAPEELRDKYSRLSKGHLPVVEGVMGYFDGLGGSTTRASSWEVAHILDLPAVLVVDARGASVSLAAVIKGFLEFERPMGSQIKAVIFNRMSPMLYPRIRELVERETGIRAAGFVPELDFLKVGSRHLGLVLPEEIAGLREQMNRLGKCLEETIDWEFLEELGAEKEERDALEEENTEASCTAAFSFRLGIAMDEAFCFYYQDNLRLLERLGGELVYFSPIHDRSLPEQLDGLILGGGYPELYCEALSLNESMRESVKKAAEGGLPVLGECGGYLYLLEELEAEDGRIWPMTGVLKGKGYKKGKNSRFGYIGVEAEKDSLYLKPGEQIRGHEFHYWDCEVLEEEWVMRAKKPVGNRSWPCIRIKNQVMAGFPHLFYPSCPAFAVRFAKACVRYKRKRDEAEE
ncbi:cobyrinate a,c-diamide synthase [Enterocloster sp.]|uniref:cobyrinate a,c-diamide synthase n=1 Tax=Enterocloster sp. TaxID=2719315 RepID=UPI00294249DB|nr:cobyrinate a,c-diamide synthase [uncultured Enterocloster sp.]MBS5086881.1 cobyrinate a,c-diamide synthase [Clostridiaceae bacterium]